MKAEVLAQHRWLTKLVGEWRYESECPGEPGDAAGADAQKMTGTETVRMLGDIWMLGESSGQMPGGEPMSAQFTVGYDPDKRHFVGTWIGSMMTELWNYHDGWLDDAQEVLTLEAEGPTFDGSGKRATYRDIIEVVDADHRNLTGNLLGADGKWTCFMTTHYRRVRT
jgi:hypothetical protein